MGKISQEQIPKKTTKNDGKKITISSSCPEFL
jgi:hypothetical protein